MVRKSEEEILPSSTANTEGRSQAVENQSKDLPSNFVALHGYKGYMTWQQLHFLQRLSGICISRGINIQRTQVMTS